MAANNLGTMHSSETKAKMAASMKLVQIERNALVAEARAARATKAAHRDAANGEALELIRAVNRGSLAPVDAVARAEDCLAMLHMVKTAEEDLSGFEKWIDSLRVRAGVALPTPTPTPTPTGEAQ